MNDWWSESYKTEEAEKATARIVNLPGQPTMEVLAGRYEAGLGDLVYEYVKRTTMPWWRRLFHIGFKGEVQSIRARLNTVLIVWFE